MARLLLVDDDPALRAALCQALGAQGHELLEAASGPEGLAKGRQAQPDLMLLDLGLPGLDGHEVLARLRAEGHRFPVLLLSARQGELEKVRGFTLGADDYVVKPFGLMELLARVGALLRRHGEWAQPEHLGPLAWGDWQVDFQRGTLQREGRHCPLPPKALPLLELLVRARGAAVDREAIVRALWGPSSEANTRSIDNLVVKLRAALEPQPNRPQCLVTAHGQGYRWLGPLPGEGAPLTRA